MEEHPLSKRLVAVCLVLASMIALTNAGIQPVISQAFTTATSTERQTYFTVAYTTSAIRVTAFTVQFVSVTSFYTYTVVQATTLTSFVTRVEIISTSTRKPEVYPAPMFHTVHPSKPSFPSQTTLGPSCTEYSLYWRNSSLGLIESREIQCLA